MSTNTTTVSVASDFSDVTKALHKAGHGDVVVADKFGPVLQSSLEFGKAIASHERAGGRMEDAHVLTVALAYSTGLVAFTANMTKDEKAKAKADGRISQAKYAAILGVSVTSLKRYRMFGALQQAGIDPKDALYIAARNDNTGIGGALREAIESGMSTQKDLRKVADLYSAEKAKAIESGSTADEEPETETRPARTTEPASQGDLVAALVAAVAGLDFTKTSADDVEKVLTVTKALVAKVTAYEKMAATEPVKPVRQSA